MYNQSIKERPLLSFYSIPGLKDFGDLPPRRIDKYADCEFSPQGIMNVVSNYLNIPLELITKRGRNKDVVYARKMCVYLIRRYTKFSLNETSLFFNDALTDHTSVRHSQIFIHEQVTGKFKNESIVNDLTHIMQLLEHDGTIKSGII